MVPESGKTTFIRATFSQSEEISHSNSDLIRNVYAHADTRAHIQYTIHEWSEQREISTRLYIFETELNKGFTKMRKYKVKLLV